MSKSEEGLKEAFAGESQANRKYLAFSKQAEKEGHSQVAKLFRAVAEAETVHALTHLRTLGVVKSTAENLQAALDGETFEFTTMYPAMIQDAVTEGDKPAERTFNYANEVEKIHAALYTNAIANLGSMPEVDYYVCSVCGFTCESQPPDKCPVCNAVAKAFIKVD